jgi:hypothetical protein
MFGTIGPIGGLDDGSHLFFTDFCNDTLYRFNDSVLADGGSASAPGASAINGLDGGLAVSHGTYFGIVQLASGVVPAGLYAFDPATLKLTTTAPVVPATSFGSGTPKGVAADPQSSDVYVSSDSGIYRVQNPLSATPTVTQFVSGNFDGLAFNGGGSVLYATHNSGSLVGHVVGFARDATTAFDVNVGGAPDGVAVAPTGQITGGTDVSNNVFVNNNDGTVERIDTNRGNAVSPVATGGTRGDFAFVDTRGGLDVSQSASYIRLSPAFFGVLPRNTSLPKITGTVSPQSTVSCSTGTWTGSPASYSYQWNRDGERISRATGTTYTITGGDAGHSLTCAVTASNVTGQATAVSAAVVVPGPPACSVAARVTITKVKPQHGSRKAAVSTVRAIKVTVSCDQSVRGRLVGAVQATVRMRRGHGKPSTTKTITTAFAPLTLAVGSTRPSVATETLSSSLVARISAARRAVARFSLRATNAKGVATPQVTLTLVPRPRR